MVFLYNSPFCKWYKLNLINPIDLKKDNSSAFIQLNGWLNTNSLFLNYEKSQYIHFMTKSSSIIDIVIGYNNELHTSTSNTKLVE